MFKFLNGKVQVLLTLVFITGITACGGSSGGASGPAAPVLNPIAMALKQLQFSWNDVAADTYRLMVNPDGVSGFTQMGADLVTTSTTLDISVFSTDFPNAEYMIEACIAALCTDSNIVTFTGATTADSVATTGYFKASNPSDAVIAGDFFGRTVALSADGTTMVVGANGEESTLTGINPNGTDNGGALSGAIYVYSNSSGTWVEEAYIKSSTNTGAGEQFGWDVAISDNGNTIAVGARNDTIGGTGGAVYVFTRTGSTWTEEAIVTAATTDAGDSFGRSVTLSADGSTLAVGANGEDSNDTGIGGAGTDNSAGQSGAVYVFTRTGTTWTEEEYIKASNTGGFDQFGYDVALSADGNTLAVGARWESSDETGIGGTGGNDLADSSGAVYVFTRAGSTWTEEEYIKASNTDLYDAFGASVSLSNDGNTLAVGASHEESNATGIGGDETDNSVDNFNASVNAGAAGAVYVFTRAGTTWTQQEYIKASNTNQTANPNADGFYKTTLSGDGNTLAVGANSEASKALGINGDETNPGFLFADGGAVYVFNRVGTTWSQIAYVKASNTDSGDQFGDSVSLSDDGTTLAVGARNEDGGIAGVGGDATDNTLSGSGAVYLY